jgi:hypothetical protein
LVGIDLETGAIADLQGGDDAFAGCFFWIIHKFSLKTIGYVDFRCRR